ncbi:DoxX subfamily [Acidobacteria bacterium AH-259-L09]|nr:DoxX subfamily [Acidobacteria bacterium AH-259-L09]
MNPSSDTLSSGQQFVLVLLRFSVGWHLFYQGFGKLQAVDWTSQGYLQATSGPLAFLFHGIAQSPPLLGLADAITIWGLMILGLFLMIGLFSQASAMGGFFLLMLFYLAAPPLAYQGFIVETAEGTELYINKTLLEAFALLVVLSFQTGRMAGLDILIDRWRAGRESQGGQMAEL